METGQRLGVGVIGAGFIGSFHARAWQGVRDADIVAVTSRTRTSAETLAREVQELGVGADVTVHDDIAALVRDPRVDAVWVLTPNFTRVEVVQAITREVTSGRARLIGIAVEKPLGRTVAEAREVLGLVEGAGLLHGYLENQLFSPSITRAHGLVWERGAKAAGTPYLARAAEEHSGPHNTWFWNGADEGGGVLNDMMCHSVEAGRFLLTPPGADTGTWLTPVSVTASINSLKWGRTRYAAELARTYPDVVDYMKSPSEDYAHAVFEFLNGDGEPVVVEATTSWSYVGAGLRLSFELLGPEYSMDSSTLSTESRVFLSRDLQQGRGEDLVEKQNAEQGLMPIVSDEAMSYGYTGEDRAFTADFLAGRQPRESLANGLQVVELLMAAYRSAEMGQTVTWPVDLAGFTPAVAKGEWNPRRK
ncbi:MAG: Gfo/Idh/MocA family oxidoreductase [Actinomyces sp.]|jgi:predicted dehydrogenase|nr:Gfo/Idh/MocA family oxidoreductase [Actinomyces sp.]MCI1641779.1 Gfo/Idh/MocA family oxidoreductase [Actinomyces sp.]MCI1661595.1 Gfo/Idh/MocA family oxidoreductase [Actinomyces sp.]MCI1690584.1 Gfo/Idh/MocA family oxidoreductase [Actinomyces sp.]MCI1786620.1 Gfo/Idh/MocA family oxidoreductase [Actinomyces sp.]MCI1830684.1 Gfo/Idh/MocA family oxidoreductase [Actinomyces sp.]